MSNFKVGQKVRIVRALEGMPCEVADVGCIVEIALVVNLGHDHRGACSGVVLRSICSWPYVWDFNRFAALDATEEGK